ncbi:MAG: CHAT domain-containing protein [Cyanobacteria bacterium]|nr:CHAT domain-containing protein [Cyanobacteriota bacterium]
MAAIALGLVLGGNAGTVLPVYAIEDHDQAAERCLGAWAAESDAALPDCLATIDALIQAGLEDSAGAPGPGGLPAGITPLQQALILARLTANPTAEIRVLHSLGQVYEQVGRHSQALGHYEAALTLARTMDDPLLTATSLVDLGRVYGNLGNTAAALAALQGAQTYFEQGNDRLGVAHSWLELGHTFFAARQFPAAQTQYEAALGQYRDLGDRHGEAQALQALGIVSQRQEHLDAALDYQQAALVLYETLADPAGIQTTLTHIGGVYHLQRRYGEAIATYEQALAISLERNQLADEATLWQNLGLSYTRLGDGGAAISAFHQAATLYEVLGYRGLQGESLSNIAQLLAEQGQTELAIALYKEAIAVLETVRQDLRVLPLALQQVFPQTFAGTYRALADLLLSQDRVIEAQQVLELLRVQEIDDYLNDVPRAAAAPLGASPLPSEAGLVDLYNQTVAQGRELAQLRQIPRRDRTEVQQQRIAALVTTQQSQRANFNDFIGSADVQALVQTLDANSQGQNLDLRDLSALQDNLRQLDHAVLLYPLILEDRLELVLVTADAPPVHYPVPVTANELQQTIARLGVALTSPTGDVEPPARQLYDWLIRPLESALAQADAETVLYAPDGQLRYVPLAALYDGNQWLVENYRITNLTAASLTDFDAPPATGYSLLAAAFSAGQYQVTVGTRQVSLAGLPFAGVEVDTLAAVFADSTVLLNQAFDPATTIPQLDDYSLVHLATHAEFLPGDPEASFILFGNGDRVTLRDVATWSLRNVELIVLSACQTGVGGTLGNGEEILGFGYQLQRAGAHSAIASLWSVDDGGTQALMTAFYQTLSQGTSKAEALRQAQLALINDNQAILSQTQRSIGVVPVEGTGRNAQIPSSFSHPYYWAPFILIGNGL